jgi:hypothetical protein
MTDTQSARVRRGHFSEEDWVDYVRRLGGDRRGLERHLATGCRPCGSALRFWEAVLGLAGHEASYSPPDGVVGQARAEFALRRPETTSRLARTASLIFDSFHQPQPVGVRASGPGPLQLVYKSGHHMVMLRVEPTAASDRVSIVGQILDEANPKRSLQDVAVLVLKGGETLDRTLTNQLGEFQLESERAESLRISVGIPEIGSLTVPLPFGARGESAPEAKGAQKAGRRTVRRTKARRP